MKVTILGCGGSDGVPRAGGPGGGGDWGDCDPANPKNRRTRVSVFVETGGANLLIDTAPDLRQQVLAARIERIDAVLFTHAHADHCHGLHELRRFADLKGQGPLPVHADPETLDELTRRFDYAFAAGAGGAPYTPIVRAYPFEGPFDAAGVRIEPFVQDHGFGQKTRGFRIGKFAYSTDVVDFPKESRAALQALDLWVVDCVQFRAGHPTHAWFDRVLEWVGEFRPARTVLTHMGPDMDYEAVKRRCPDRVEPGYDGMRLTL